MVASRGDDRVFGGGVRDRRTDAAIESLPVRRSDMVVECRDVPGVSPAIGELQTEARARRVSAVLPENRRVRRLVLAESEQRVGICLGIERHRVGHQNAVALFGESTLRVRPFTPFREGDRIAGAVDDRRDSDPGSISENAVVGAGSGDVVSSEAAAGVRRASAEVGAVVVLTAGLRSVIRVRRTDERGLRERVRRVVRRDEVAAGTLRTNVP